MVMAAKETGRKCDICPDVSVVPSRYSFEICIETHARKTRALVKIILKCSSYP